MPSTDYDEKDQTPGGIDDGFTPAQSAAVGSATGGPAFSTPAKQQEPEFVPWSRFVSANQDVSKREAGRLTGQVQGDINTAQSDLSGGQSGFNSGMASNYGTPKSKSTLSASTAPASVAKQTPGPGASSPSSSKAGPATSSPWSTLQAPVTPFNTPSMGTTAPTGGLTGVKPPRPTGVPLAGGLPPPLPPAPPPPKPGDTLGITPQVISSAPALSGLQSSPAAPQPASAALQGDNPAPWSSFMGPVSNGSVAPSQTAASTQGGAGIKTYQRSQDLGANVVANGPQGPKDLESSMSPEAWSKLLGDTKKASDEASALGSENGVEALLQQNQSAPGNTKFDAALINGQGGPQFAQLAQKYGKGQLTKGIIDAEQKSEDKWNQLSGDVSTAQTFKSASDKAIADKAARDAATDALADKGRADALNTSGTDAPPPDGQTAPSDKDNSLSSILYGNNNDQKFWSDLHQAGLSLSPLDWAAVGIGEAGTDAPLPTEEFSKNFDYSKGEIQKSWPAAKVQWAYSMVQSQYPSEALDALRTELANNPEMLKQYLSMHNPGFMARNMRAWMENAGFGKKTTPHPSGETLQDVPIDAQAANDGWYDVPGGYLEQIRNGVAPEDVKIPEGYPGA